MLSPATRIGLRYLRTRKRTGFMSFISTISIIGIAIGVIALIVVLSVMNGFQSEIRGQLLRAAPHMEIGHIEDGGTWQDLADFARKDSDVAGVAPFVVGQALLANAGEVRGIQIKGIDPATFGQVNALDKLTPDIYQKLHAGGFGLILGESIAQALGLNTGDKVTVITPDGNVTPAGMVPRMKQFTVVAVVPTGSFALDNALALTHLDDAARLYRLTPADTALQIKLKHPNDAPQTLERLQAAPDAQHLWLRDWTFQNRDYFQAVEIEKKMMFVIMFFISLVASINLISTLIMTVTEKQSAIAILRTLGMNSRDIMKIFIVQGGMLGLIGTATGVCIGLILAWNVGNIVHFIEQISGRSLISASVYFIDYVPSKVQWQDVAAITGISLLLSLTVTLYPSMRAAKTDPAKALRYE